MTDRKRSVPNNALVPTRKGDAPLLAAQRRRWAENMNILYSCVVALLVCLGGCTTAEKSNEAEISAADSAHIDVAACHAGGGKIKRVCMLQVPACITPFPDAGRRCTDNSECQGKCILEIDHLPEPKETVSGRCQKDDDPCGCKYEVVNGKLGEDSRCVD